MAETETVPGISVDELRERYVAARRTYKEAEKKFGELIAGYTDMPEALKTKLSYVELAGQGSVAVNPPPSGPPWAQPATPPAKQIISRKEWPRIDEYIEALGDLRRKQVEAERLYNSLPELDRQLGSKYRSPLEP
ncbi:MAG: hypothetical protein ACLQU2_19910 [Candidatus Binataceae bacterium]